MGFVYILQDERGKFYIGSTNDVNRRFDQHKHGHTWSTKRFKNLKLVFSQEFKTLEVARKIELKLKKLKRRKQGEEKPNEPASNPTNKNRTNKKRLALD